MRALDSHALGIIRRRFSPYLGLFLFIASRRNRLCLQPERWTGKFSRTLSTSEPPHRTQCWHHHRPHPGPYHALAADDFFRVHRRWKKAKRLGQPWPSDRNVDISYTYFALCVLGAAAHASDDTKFFWGLCVL